MKKLIPQESPAGCAVACVANLLEVEYKTALKLFTDGERKHLWEGFYNKEIIKALDKGGVNARSLYIRDGNRTASYKNGTIVFISRDKKYPRGHYLLRKNDKWLDPWINYPHITPARAGYRARLSGKPQHAVLILNKF